MYNSLFPAPPPPLIIHLPSTLPPLSSYIHHCMTLGWGVGFRILYYNLSDLSNNDVAGHCSHEEKLFAGL